MANLTLQFIGPTGTYYANIFDKNYQVYVPTSGIFKNYLSNEQSQYAISLSGTSRLNQYYNIFTFLASSGLYDVDFIRQVGGIPDKINDRVFICDTLYWDGTQELGINTLTDQGNRFTFTGDRVNASTTGYSFNPHTETVTLATGLHPLVVIPTVTNITNPVSITSNSDILSIKNSVDQMVFTSGALNVYCSGMSPQAVNNIFNKVVESGLTFIETFRIMSSALAGFRSGGGTSTISFLGLDGATTRIQMNVDASGNSLASPTLNGA